MRNIIYIIAFAFIAISCGEAKKSGSDSIAKHSHTKYAKGFDIILSDSLITVTVSTPLNFPNSEALIYRLCLGSKTNLEPDVISIPVKRVVCMSSTHIGFIGALNADSVIVGISGTKYVNNPKVFDRIVNGKIAEVGYDQGLNYELLSRLKPDVVFAYGVGSESLSYIDKLKELGLRVVMVPDYLETSPLGRAEWIKFFGVFLGKQKLADSIFNAVEVNYKNLCSVTPSNESKPKVFLNMPFRDIWYFPGTENYFVQFISDAGGNYVFPELKGSQSHPVSTEVAYKTGLDCDVWLNTGIANSLGDIAATDMRFTDFKAFKSGRVYNNNKRIGQGGGNDFWESGVVHPDFILRDLMKIFHPTLFPNDSLYFYKHLE